MKKGKPMVILLDVDNVLMPCTETAYKKATSRGFPVDVKDVTQYSFANFPKEISKQLMEIFNEPDFFDDQEPYPGAVEMVDELLDAGHEVVIASAMKPHQMGIRANQIPKFFPRIPARNILLGSRKDLLNADFLLDDAMENIITSRTKYPVVFSQPWNMSEEGYLRVSGYDEGGYDEFIRLVEAVSLAPTVEIPKMNSAGHTGMICLVGPSASGKSFICDELVKNPLFRKARALTTRTPRPDGADAEDYKFVTEQEFLDAVDRDDLVEHTVYAGHRYGIAKSEIQEIWHDGRIAVKPVDIHGAMACKSVFGDRCMTVFVRRNKEDIVTSLLERDVSTDDKVRRLMTLDKEMENEQLCDWTVSNNGSLEHAIQQILRIVG